MAKVFIGMPVYNGAPYQQYAIQSILNQSFSDWVLLISDNGSSDDTEKISNKFVHKDTRIKYFRHQKNLGAVNNFKYVLDQADLAYFMWAAADDIWEPEYLASCVHILENDGNCGMAFCNIVNIDTYGREIREYRDFSRLTSGVKLLDVCKYLLDPEIMGKANLIYSVYHLDLCKKSWEHSPLTNHWGSDMCFVFAAILQSQLKIEKKILFKKRIIRPTDAINKVDVIKINPHLKAPFPINKSMQYSHDMIKSASGTKYYFIALIIMIFRVMAVFFLSIPRMFRYLYHKIFR